MDRDTARENYNRICGLINILSDMRLKTSMRINNDVPTGNMSTWTPEQIQDHLYIASIGDVISHLETLRERTPWLPAKDKPGEGYL